MAFDWRRAIERNRDDIYDIVIFMLRISGIAMLAPYDRTLPRHLYKRLMSILVPAEFAARRLIAMAACKLELKIPAAGERLADRDRKRARKSEGEINPDWVPPFQLFDPFPRYGPVFLTEAEFAERQSRPPLVIPPPLPADDPVPALGLCRRIHALRFAMQDLEDEARRLVRWRARRHLKTTRPRRFSPMRPGLPPGWKKHPKEEHECVVKECHILARDAWDTS